MLRRWSKRFDAWLIPWLRRQPVLPKVVAFSLAPWPFAVLLYALVGSLYEDGHVDWSHVFQYPITLCWMTPLYWYLYKQGRWPKRR